MTIEDHPIITEIKSYAGEVSNDEFRDRVKADLMRLDPLERQASLNHIRFLTLSDTVHDGEPVSLRQRAQLLQLHRDLDDAHRTLRKAGR